jgi:hypothetical protein
VIHTPWEYTRRAKVLHTLIEERDTQAASATVAAVNAATDVDLTLGVDSTATTKDASPAFKFNGANVSTAKDAVVAAVTGNEALTKPMQYAFNGNLLQLELAANDFGLVLQETLDTPRQVQSKIDAGIDYDGVLQAKEERDGAQGNALEESGAQVQPAHRCGGEPREANYPRREFQGSTRDHVERAGRHQW